MLAISLSGSTASARASRTVATDEWIILAPGILADAGPDWYVWTSSHRGVIPQGGDWSLDWDGGLGLPAGHYDGIWNCFAALDYIEFEPEVRLGAIAHCVIRSPSEGVIIQNPITITQTGALCPTETGNTPFRAEWRMTIRATGVYAGLTDLSGNALAVFEGLC